jgi:hypothetical protein
LTTIVRVPGGTLFILISGLGKTVVQGRGGPNVNWIFISSAVAGVQMIRNEIGSNDENLIMGTPQKETSVSAGPPDAKFTPCLALAALGLVHSLQDVTEKARRSGPCGDGESPGHF